MDDKQLVDSANTITFQHRAGKEKRCLAANGSQRGDVQEKSRGQKQVISLWVSSHSKNIRLKKIIPSYRLDEDKHTQEKKKRPRRVTLVYITISKRLYLLVHVF
jgi:hypothetical protein